MYLESCNKSVLQLARKRQYHRLVYYCQIVWFSCAIQQLIGVFMQLPSHISFWNQGTSSPDISRGVAVM